jgi:hypothetical protein
VSPELETLDQLLGGDMPLAVIRQLYGDAAGFVRGLGGLLATGEVRLVAADGAAVPAWQWRETLAADPLLDMTVSLTPAGARRIMSSRRST